MKKLLFVFISILFSLNTYAQSELDSLYEVINKPNPSIEKARAYHDLGEKLYTIDPDTLKYFTEQSLMMLEEVRITNKNKQQYKQIQSDVYNNIGYYYYLKTDFESALKYYNKALSIKRSIKDVDGSFSAENNIALIYSDQGNLVGALEIYYKALKQAEKNKSLEYQATAYNNIGYVYSLQKDYDNSMSNYRKSLNIRKDLRDKYGIATCSNNIGFIFREQNQLDSALVYYKKALKYRRELNAKRGIAISSSNLAEIYIDQENYSEAESLLFEAVEICQKNGYQFNESNALRALCLLRIAQDDYILPQEKLPRLKELYETLGLPKPGLNYTQVAIQVAHYMKDWKTAYDLKNLQDELEERQASKEMIFLSQQRKYEVLREKENAKNEVEHAKEVAREKRAKEIAEERQTRLFIIVASMVLIILIGGYLYYRNSKTKQRLMEERLNNNKLLQEKLQLENEKKSRELTGFSLRMTSNSQFVNEIDEILQSTEDKNKEEVDELLRNLRQKVKINERNERDWQEFQRQFQGVHSDFIQRLREEFPALTQKEIRLCMLIRLNAASDEIVNLLGISKSTLKSSRYRINKKIDLPEGTTLYQFISHF